ncbi:hypothetical protein DY000_02002662 [Brassica cretica]|uniref:Ubiquitin-like protease family profile domain-containing protein n=1 Tax=Brassica cretica TaxID=69181 RepID=A0ABQ7CIR3_BRACR|nr:hypothetical protein DY000_02002662 [Brassica cretica]
MIEDTTHSRNQLEWDDEIDDETVDNLVRLIQNGKVVFNKAMFVGGLTGVDLSRMRAEKKQKEKECKDKKEPESQPDVLATDAVDIGSSSRIANLVAGLINKKIADALSIKDAKIEQSLAKVIIAQREKMEGEVIRSIIGFLGKQMPTSVREEDTSGRGQSGGENVDAANSAGPVLSPEDHGNQLGVAGSPLTRKEPLPHAEYNDSQSQADEVINKVINDVQEFANPYDLTATENSHNLPLGAATVHESVEHVVFTEVEGFKGTPIVSDEHTSHIAQLPTVDEEEALADTEENVGGIDQSVPDIPALVTNDEIGETRRSKRTRMLPPIFNLYQCDAKIKAFRVEENMSINDRNVDEIYLSMRERVADNHKGTHSSNPKVAVYDTSFPVSIISQHARLTKTAVKDRCRIKYDDATLQYFKAGPDPDDTYDRIYFPFCIDKQHWVGVCIDIPSSSVQILDCNSILRTDNQIKKDINPITVVIPHIIHSVRGAPYHNATKPFGFFRAKGIPQHPNQPDSGVVTVLLIQGHAANDIEGCAEVTPFSLPPAAKHLAVLVLRDIAPV